MEWLTQNPAALYVIIGLILIGIDIIIIGLSPLMFVGVGALVTSGVLYITGSHPEIALGLALWAFMSGAVAIVGWRPLHHFQNAHIQEDNTSDLVGRELTVSHEVTKEDAWIEWSGTHWLARLASDADVEKLDPGTHVKVVAVKDLVLVLRPL